MLLISSLLRPFVMDVTFWIAQPHGADGREFVLVVTVLVWRSTPDHIRRRIRRALRRGITAQEIFEVWENQPQRSTIIPELLRSRVHVYTDRRNT